jgi:antirestriction protein ArdC
MQDQPATDSIQLPPRPAFTGTPTSTSAESYYSTLLHLITALGGFRPFSESPKTDIVRARSALFGTKTKEPELP